MLADPETGAFCDPARRTERGRSWRVEDLRPAWSFVADLLSGAQPAGVKLGPGLPHALIPADVEAEWVSSDGDTVEVGLWSGSAAKLGEWSALVASESPHRLVASATDLPPARDRLGAYLYEPLGAVIRCRGIPTLAGLLGAGPIHPGPGLPDR